MIFKDASSYKPFQLLDLIEDLHCFFSIEDYHNFKTRQEFKKIISHNGFILVIAENNRVVEAMFQFANRRHLINGLNKKGLVITMILTNNEKLEKDKIQSIMNWLLDHAHDKGSDFIQVEVDKACENFQSLLHLNGFVLSGDNLEYRIIDDNKNDKR